MKNKKIEFKKRINNSLLLTGFVCAVIAIIGIGYYNKNIAKEVAAADGGCPSSDWVPIGDFCIMDDELGGGPADWGESVHSCAHDEDARLCTVSEWMMACKLDASGAITLTDIDNNYEWVGDMDSNGKALRIGDGGCGAIDDHDMTNNSERRCCVNREASQNRDNDS